MAAYLHQHPFDWISSRAQLNAVTAASYQFGQVWLQPAIDYSIPPQQIYSTIPAWQLLEGNSRDSRLNSLAHRIVIIAAGGYDESGLAIGQGDTQALPKAVRHWRFWQKEQTTSLDVIFGGEVLSYATYQYLQNRLVVPLPDFWLIPIAAALGQAAVLALRAHPQKQASWLKWFLGATVLYGVFSLQFYVAAAVVLPWLLPALTFWSFILPERISLWRRLASKSRL